MKRIFVTIIVLLVVHLVSFGQDSNNNRFSKIEDQLKLMSVDMPGLEEKIELSVSDMSIQDFVRAIANSSKINIHISPDLDMRINNNFTNISVSNILVFLCRQYDLNITSYNNILSITKWKPVEEKKPAPVEKKN